MTRLNELVADPHLVHTGYFEMVTDPAMGLVRFPGVPVKFDGQKQPITMPPRLGEHTRAELARAGLDEATIDALIASGAARVHQAVPDTTSKSRTQNPDA